MKKSNLKLVLALLLVAIAGIIVYSCRKSEGPPDPNATMTVERKLVISALNSFANDSIGQFSVAITAPSGTINQVATGNTVVIKDPVAGAYVIVVSKTGYTTSSAQTVNITLPADAKTSMTVKVSVGLNKTAAAVAITSAAGGTIAVKSNSEVASSATVANVTVPAATVFTLADGTKPASVNISVTNVPVMSQLAPVMNIGGVEQVLVNNVEVIKDQMPIKNLDLQPEGMSFDKPMIIDVYIGDQYPDDMPLDVKTAEQDGLTMNYVRKDGTVEVVTPDHFSADRNTVYYKITHFSNWHLMNRFWRLTSVNVTLSEVKTQVGECGGPLGGTFTYEVRYKRIGGDPFLPWLLTGSKRGDAVYSISLPYSVLGQTGFYIQATWQCTLLNYTLSYTGPSPYWKSYGTRGIVIPILTSMPTIQFIPCHNQGGHNQGG